MSTELSDWALARLIAVAKAYAKAKNLDGDVYVCSILECMERTAREEDVPVQIEYLLRYHNQWLKDCK